MTKVQIREANVARQAVELNMPDMAARIISALIRCAMRQADKQELHALAAQLGIAQHPDFIV